MSAIGLDIVFPSGKMSTESDQLHESFRRITAGRRFNALVMAVFGVIASALAIVGIYGTMRFLVIRQSRDIGVRLALGATRGRILRSVLTTALAQVMLGATLGLAVAWAISSVFRSLVFGVAPTEPRVYGEVAGAIALCALLAAGLPAWRASRLDPVETLRQE